MYCVDVAKFLTHYVLAIIFYLQIMDIKEKKRKGHLKKSTKQKKKKKKQ